MIVLSLFDCCDRGLEFGGWAAALEMAGGRVRAARDILDERYARGEIGREEYQRRREDLAGI
jgi:uncharacterized membrane protein